MPLQYSAFGLKTVQAGKKIFKGQSVCARWFSGFISHSLKRQKGPWWSFGVKIYSLLIKKRKKKKPLLGQIIDSRLPSNVRKCSPPSRGSRRKGYLILSAWFCIWNNCLKWLVLAWETVCLPGTWTSVINFNVLLWVFPQHTKETLCSPASYKSHLF